MDQPDFGVTRRRLELDPSILVPALFAGLFAFTSFMAGHRLAFFATQDDGLNLATVLLIFSGVIAILLIILGAILTFDGSKTAPVATRILGVVFSLLGCGFVLGAVSGSHLVSSSSCF